MRVHGYFSRPGPDRPLISVVTVVFNGEANLEQTIQSVINQTYDNVEYIIIDGGSTDGSRSIIEKYDSCVSYWLSEPDRGIADAMNKGLQLSIGDYFLLLHSDDYLLEPDTLERAVHYLKDPSPICAFSLYFDYNGQRQLTHPKPWNWRMNFKTSLLHQAVICRRDLFEQIGGFDAQFKIAMDYDFFLRAYREGINVRYINIPISVMRKIGVSAQTDDATLRRRFLEEKTVHRKNSSSMWLNLIYMAYWVAYPLYRMCK